MSPRLYCLWYSRFSVRGFTSRFLVVMEAVVLVYLSFFFFSDTPPTEIYTLSLHDALPICPSSRSAPIRAPCASCPDTSTSMRSEEHTSELQSRQYLVCRLLLEKKKTASTAPARPTPTRAANYVTSPAHSSRPATHPSTRPA